MWDIESGQCLKRVVTQHDGFPHDTSIAVDWLKLRVLMALHNSLELWDLTAGQCTLSLQHQTSSIKSLSVDWQANRVLSGSGLCSLDLWDLALERHLRKLGEDVEVGEGSGAYFVSMNWAKRRALSSAHGADEMIKLWDLETGQGLHSYRMRAP